MKFIYFLLFIFFFSNAFGQNLYEKRTKELFNENYLFQDTLRKKTTVTKNISGIFAGVGGGLSIPTSAFKNNSDVTFGILGRLDFSSTHIFPFVIGAEVTYFSYGGDDQFKTVSELTNFTTDIIGFGLNLEYLLTKIVHSAFTMPFVSVDVKYNSIKREYDIDTTLEDLKREETGFSVGGGIGFTMFVLDFHIKYNYLKNNQNIGVYVKTKFPVIRF